MMEGRVVLSGGPELAARLEREELCNSQKNSGYLTSEEL